MPSGHRSQEKFCLPSRSSCVDRYIYSLFYIFLPFKFI
uniref:Uncharacterized protein n=1 Tax=Anguilla anguilla TaxID=7936 RepID=A0A0E9TG17_ANGAN